MATLTRTQVSIQSHAAAERSRLIRLWAVRIVIYLALSFAAFIMLYPFLYMFFTSLKTATDVFTYPPRLLPYTTVTTEYQGEQVPVYELTVDGQKRAMIVDSDSGNVPFGFFTTESQINAADPQASAGLVQVKLDDATETGKTVTVGDKDYPVYEVMVNGQTEERVLAYRRGLKRFFDPQDPSVEAYSIERTTPLLERVDFQFQNYNAVLELKNLNRALINTTVVTVMVTIGQVVTSVLGGYAFSRMHFRGREALFLVYLGTIMIPFVVLIIPLYQLMVVIGWQKHLSSLIFPWLFTAYGTFLMRQFFITIPKELEEAAFLDGLSRFGILWRIFVPLSGPAIATQAIITFLYAWNSFLWPLVIIGDSTPQNHVMTLALNQLRNAAASEPNLVLTGAAVAILPPLIVFILAQRYFIEGIASTGLKG